MTEDELYDAILRKWTERGSNQGIPYEGWARLAARVAIKAFEKETAPPPTPEALRPFLPKPSMKPQGEHK